MNDSSPAQPESPPCILLVDDEPRLIELARLALAGRFEVLTTTSPVEALALGANPAVRLVLTDFVMDEMTGVELIRRVRETRPDLPCILFSGNLTRENWVAAVNAGCRHVFAKPLALASIIALCTELLFPRPEAIVPEGNRAVLEAIPWRGALGQTLRELADYLLAGRSPLFLQTPGGPFPHELLLLLLPELQLYPRPDTPPPPRPLFTDLSTLDLEQQTRIAQLLPARRDIPWLLCADAAPEELMERGRLSKSLYLRLSSVLFNLPPPADCPEDTLHLCRWWLLSRTPSTSLATDATDWLANRLPHLDWRGLLALLREAGALHPGQPISTHALQRASLALTLGHDLADIPHYADYADHHTRQLRAAWEALGLAAGS